MSKIKKLAAIMLSMVMLVCVFGISAGAESIYDTAKAVSSGKTYSTTLPSYGYTSDYKITASKAGELKLAIISHMSILQVYVYDSDGNILKPSQRDFKSGGYSDTWDYYYWNDTIEKFNGTLTYGIEKGTYYIRIIRDGSGGNGKLSFSATFPSSSSGSSSTKTNTTSTSSSSGGSKVDYIMIELSKGSKIQLNAYGSFEAGDTWSWSTSDSSVASITKNGLVTAKKAGMAKIKFKIGTSVRYVMINVS